MIRIGIIEDDLQYKSALQEYLKAVEDVRCVICADSMADFTDRLKPYHQIDILLLDIHLPGESGINSIPELRQLLPDTQIIMNTMEEDADMLFKAFNYGAEGYLLKDIGMEELVRNLYIIRDGGAVISPSMARYLVQHFAPPVRPKYHSDLGEKDNQVLHLLARGWSYEHIANELGISVNGVRYYIRKLYKRLNINSRYEAAQVVQEKRHILPPKDTDKPS